MALKFQNVPVIFSKGIKRTDPYLLSPGDLTRLENMVFEDAETITSRNGLFPLNMTPKVGSIPSPYTRTNAAFTGTPYRMAQNQGSLILEGSQGIFSRPALQAAIAVNDATATLQARTATGTAAGGRPDFVRATVETDYVGTFAYPEGALLPVYGTYPGGQSHDMARIENYDGAGHTMSLFAWVENSTASATMLHLRAFDEGEDGTTGPRVARSQVFDLVIPTANASSSVRVLASATDFFVMLVNTTTNVISVPFRLTAATGAVAYPTYTATSTGTSQIFDAMMDSSGSIVIAYRDGATTMRLALLNAAASAESSGTTVAITGALETLSIVYGLQGANRTYNVLYTCTATPAVIRGNFITHGGATGTETTVFTAGSTVRRITGVDYDPSAASFAVFFDEVLGDVSQLSVVKVGFAATNIGGSRGLAENAHLYARPLVTGSVMQVPVCYLLDPLYPAIFVVQAQPVSTGFYPAAVQKTVCSARIHWGAAGNIATCFSPFWRLPSTFKVTATGDMILPVTRWGAQALSNDFVVSAETQLWQSRLNFTSQDLGYAEANRDTWLAGSCPQGFDGSYFEEVGFNHRPSISVGRTAASGQLSAGVYSVYATYTRRDSRGNITESMPSELVQFTATELDGYTVTALAYGITSVPGVSVRIYRSTANGSTCYLDGGATVNVLSPGEADADITRNTRLPTDGGVLPNEPMPPCRVVVEHDDRLWCAGGETGDVVYFSQPISDDIAPEWNRLLNRRIPKSAGRVVNIVSLDDKLVVFCEKRIGFIYGDGPTRTGAQDGYSEFIEAVSGYAIPWGEPHSIARATDGVWFRCSFGFRLLGRNMQIAKNQNGDVGFEIDALLVNPTLDIDPGITVVRALISATAQQVRFYMSDATVFVYDMLFNQWSRFTNHAAVDCTAIGDDFYHITTTPRLYVQTKYAYVDEAPSFEDSDKIQSVITTGWLSFAGLQGFQRLSRVQLLAQLPTQDAVGYNVTVQAAYNFVDASLTTIYSGPLPRNAAGSTVLQVELQPTIQKCEAVQFKITLVPSSLSQNETRPIRLTALNLVVGLKQGRYKLPTASKV